MKKYLVLALAAGLIYFFSKEDRKLTNKSSVQEQVEDFSSTAPANKQPATASFSKQNIHNSGAAGVSSKYLEKVEIYLECYESDRCDYPHTDPKSYQIALNKDVAKFLKQTPVSVFLNNLEMQKGLQELMKQGDGFTQEEALRLFSQLPMSQENLTAIFEGTKNNYADPLIMEQVIAELARYNNTPMAEQVRGFVAETLMSGPQYSAEAAAQKIRPLLSENNLSYYRSIAEKTKSTAVRGSLNSSIEDYALSLSGG